jgi:hypothetical protein
MDLEPDVNAQHDHRRPHGRWAALHRVTWLDWVTNRSLTSSVRVSDALPLCGDAFPQVAANRQVQI